MVSSLPTFRETIVPSPDAADEYADILAVLAASDVSLVAHDGTRADIPAEFRAALATLARLLAASRAVRVTITDEDDAERVRRSMDAFTRLGEEMRAQAAESRHDAASG